MSEPRTLSQKVWDRHVVRQVDGEPDLLFIDLHLVHEVTSPQAFDGLRINHRRPRHPELTVAIEDHNIPTANIEPTRPHLEAQLEVLENTANSASSTSPWATPTTASSTVGQSRACYPA